ncbi:acyltransferase family protein [Paraburkholderia aromaticivorans]|uniref:Acyltransferase n=1 Tax=Paraburkholderia aromaticivorans TaxID=2026199 RepID=A0A248VMN0_9BURK|nr:acyltransferase [Paraburkholderia aromaticivorans]ASW00125.1 acyltransferase [Paraburkholderia aromaticivorans]
MPAKQINSLTSLRFFAAAMVVVFHTRREFGYFGLADHLALTQAVSLFFVLSGYILAHTHRTITSRSDLFIFYLKRFARIWPLHLAGAAAALWLIHFEGGSVRGEDAILNVLLLHAWSSDITTYFSLNGVSWSLSDEAFFYAVFPLLIWRVNATWVVKLAATVLVTAAMLLAFKNMGRPLMLWSAYISPITRLSEFMMGIAAYQLRGKLRSVIEGGWRASALEIGTALIVASAIWVADLKFVSDLPFHPIKPVAIWLSNCGVGVLFTLLIAVFALEGGALSRLLQARLLIYLGKISFALYMMHQLVLRYAEDHGYMAPDYPVAAKAALYWLAAIAVAAAAHHLIEIPAQRVILSRFTPRRGVMA